ncbi:Maf-like protein [Hyphopichia burtonii NRRL Y-1933]|uniref:Maf-like protein n=1 Tax=Hyphopichia burtonii NRRL Y-1933 TaxID=984485 RepID=A0A1E4RHG1_9ASCO|nr:Maf-like protein [Hyphopichia burtonii NRRL Y-1933]ODV66704.1 Maf-like protein [Hyphopichia burtonii NRRL Y-1933]
MFNPPLYERLFSRSQFVLALTSPRRKQILLTNLGIPEEKILVIGSNFEENLQKTDVSASEYVSLTAKHKAQAVIDQLKTGRYVVMSSDTVVLCGDEILEKPSTPKVQLEWLKKYRQVGQLSVLTSVHFFLVSQGTVTNSVNDTEVTHLKFNESLDDAFLQSYVSLGEALEAAGGFKYQEKGSLLFKGMEGDYFNVVGLPVAKTLKLMDDLVPV